MDTYKQLSWICYYVIDIINKQKYTEKRFSPKNSAILN